MSDIQEKMLGYRGAGESVGFVPTMGALHEGHVSLVQRSLVECDRTVVSVFVNPAQFGPHEDFDSYPRTLDKDLDILKGLGVDFVFTPTRDELFPGRFRDSSVVFVPGLSKILDGKSRPHFFQGVCMVVSRLFNIVRPDKAYFGEKDFQQCVIVRKMANDLHMGVEVVPCPIVRESNGLAMSSRNAYLSDAQRGEAGVIYKMMRKGVEAFEGGETDSGALVALMTGYLEKEESSVRVDYLEIVDSVSLRSRKKVLAGDRILFAGFLGEVRLIDNLRV